MRSPCSTAGSRSRASDASAARVTAPSVFQVDRVPHAGRQLQHPTGGLGEVSDPPHDERGHVVRVACVANPRQVPAPAPRPGVEGEQPAPDQLLEELNHEERVPGGLVVDQAGERSHLLGRAADGVCGEGHQVLDGDRLQHHLLHADPRLANLLDGGPQRVRGVDLVVAIGAEHQKVAGVRRGEQGPEQLEAGEVGPLKIVEEQDQRMLRGAERGDEGVEHHPEAFLGLERRQRRQRRLGPEEELGLRDDLRDQLPVRADRLGEAVPPDPLPLLAGGEQIGEHAPERLSERRIGNVALAGVELPRQEDPRAPSIERKSSCTRPDLPTPAYPEMSASAGRPLDTVSSSTAWSAASSASRP